MHPHVLLWVQWPNSSVLVPFTRQTSLLLQHCNHPLQLPLLRSQMCPAGVAYHCSGSGLINTESYIYKEWWFVISQAHWEGIL